MRKYCPTICSPLLWPVPSFLLPNEIYSRVASVLTLKERQREVVDEGAQGGKHMPKQSLRLTQVQETQVQLEHTSHHGVVAPGAQERVLEVDAVQTQAV